MNFCTTIECPLGYVKIEGNSEVICSISFSDFNSTDTEFQPDIARKACYQLEQYFLGKLQVFSLPIHQQGTEFQQKVWAQLKDIPYGKTCSYMAIARKLNNPKSIRAVGNSNGKNSLAIVIPCHRVIGESGKLVGYAAGLERKKWLLQHEAKFANGVQTLF